MYEDPILILKLRGSSAFLPANKVCFIDNKKMTGQYNVRPLFYIPLIEYQSLDVVSDFNLGNLRYSRNQIPFVPNFRRNMPDYGGWKAHGSSVAVLPSLAPPPPPPNTCVHRYVVSPRQKHLPSLPFKRLTLSLLNKSVTYAQTVFVYFDNECNVVFDHG